MGCFDMLVWQQASSGTTAKMHVQLVNLTRALHHI